MMDDVADMDTLINHDCSGFTRKSSVNPSMMDPRTSIMDDRGAGGAIGDGYMDMKTRSRNRSAGYGVSRRAAGTAAPDTKTRSRNFSAGYEDANGAPALNTESPSEIQRRT
ncbi:hypothetical protein [Sorangium sp. So ce1182]|uniref:hypothetical protein n=1 Tax=Sorangium sp. So ce1182 TaxID=3133334 RepID=UPI003F5E1A45